ncbi:hypothetical protein BAE44_0005363 [Dichanthelium oligosanthes]|uniref:Uncharacterized protein n=1 Tax=Dichanthelium oligosanthes TaxID=888268 RepID=A0A1E5W8P2_9POAL|nr:hypothetical protein BAE44_0005363 [Dichanthelium oligosanthes]
MIATYLPGCSENTVKNHWNATKRSLKAMRRLKKKKSEQQVPPGQLTMLEEYIRSVEPDTGSAAPSPPASPPLQGLANRGLIREPVHTPAAEIEMNSNTANPVGPLSPDLPDLNISCDPQEARHRSYPMYAPARAPQLQQVTQDPQQARYSWCPFFECFTAVDAELPADRSYYAGGSSSNAGTNGYYSYYSEAGPSNACANGYCSYYSEAGASNAGSYRYYSEAGPSNDGGSDGEPAGDADGVVEMASREFLTPSIDDVRLAFTRFR